MTNSWDSASRNDAIFVRCVESPHCIGFALERPAETIPLAIEFLHAGNGMRINLDPRLQKKVLEWIVPHSWRYERKRLLLKEIKKVLNPEYPIDGIDAVEIEAVGRG